MTDFAEQLEDFFKSYPENRRLYYERRSRQYARLSIHNTRIITHSNLVRSLASMFLEAPHQTTRSYKALKGSVGKEIFAKGQKLDPYYTSAFGYYRLDVNFRTQRIDPKLKPARFHILLALRLLANPDAVPRMNAHQMEAYCAKITSILWDAAKADDLIARAAKIVEEVAEGNLNRDNIRTLPFTEKVIARCKQEAGAKEEAA